jgi:DNA-binding NarL/FixJ family response regulator
MLSIPTVQAFVPLSFGFDELRKGIEAALAGRRLAFVAPHENPVSSRDALTPRQQEIRNLMRQGMTNKMIASVLGISEGTVKNHISGIFKVLNATNRTQVARLSRDSEP